MNKEKWNKLIDCVKLIAENANEAVGCDELDEVQNTLEEMKE